MNNVKLCGMIVILCVVCPVMVGYAWPASADSETVWDVEQPKNITSDLATSQVGLYSDYTDLWQNNWNLYWDWEYLQPTYEEYQHVAKEMVTTNQVTEIPGYSIWTHDETVYTTNQGLYGIQKTSVWLMNTLVNPVYGNVSMVQFYKGSWDHMEINGEYAKVVLFYPKANLLQYITEDQEQLKTHPDGGNGSILFHGQASSQYEVNMAGARVGSTYADLNYGMRLIPENGDYGRLHWYNGYNNLAVDFLVKADINTYLSFHFDGWSISILSDQYTLEVKIWKNGAWHTIGTFDLFPYIWFHIDSVTDKITVSALGGMDGFLDSYREKVRHTLVFDQAIEPFTYFEIRNRDNNDAAWLVRNTVSDYSSTAGIDNKTVDLINYSLGDPGQIQLKSILSWPVGANKLEISVNGGQTIYGSIDPDGTVTFPSIYEGTMSNMAIMMIDKTVYINGIKAIESNSAITSCTITFNGEWITNVYYSDLSSSSRPVYNWLAGAFSIDQGGFCMAGLLTSGGAASGAFLYGRRTGAKTAMVALTAAICAVFYLVMMMQ